MLPSFPPYTYMHDGKPSGVGIEAVVPILDKMGVKYTIQIGSNHGRALQQLIHDKSDGFFMASKNAERDKHAVFSKPILVNKWVWVTMKGANIDVKKASSSIRTASLLNTNTEKWLKKNNYRVATSANNVDSLVKLLGAKRVDAIFLSEAVLKEAVGGNLSPYDISVEVAKDFGFYVSKSYIEKYPTFMQELNEHISQSPAVD
ncbi:transporter substrate-binding domain-containing protein [Vibrio neptunius]|uniref:Transporter substrate-binding domain-containing protein n=2 Tax=Vibrio neptunius TaxID=170651 RepID=A0ABS3A283_9VIBR|nr:transporter substrate-binding domain-containing protein [Vibrio neptunius]MBN3516288.1 transporter substrate-binding domain-containing protein [Vibrio neptunius]MBN3550233.1 transporter substrate-binding domain-containing protein [Vibrio neptunius]MBN3578503.1 transporter substrate-binding domain-containing protein [Vibrio neptunius]MCH9872168.1 transporter substrate-binding domain-containing protein [Vibrio neptunius]